MSSISLKKRKIDVYQSLLDKKDWSFLWFCEMHELLQLMNDSVDVPLPILYSALQVIKKMAVANPQPPLQQHEISIPQLPVPRERSFTLRRAKGYSRLPPGVVKNPGIMEMLQGVEKVEELLFQFSASVDGVDVFKNSAISNSCYFFSTFCENLVRRLVPADFDAFFLLIVPCSKSEVVAQERVEEGNKDTFHDIRTGSATIPSTSCVRDNLRQARPGKKMANMVFHDILEAVLPSIKELGQVGFPIRMGRTLYHAK